MSFETIRSISRVLHNSAFGIGICVLFILLCVLFFKKRNVLSATQKIPMYICVAICILYFAFRIWGMFFAGGSAHY